MKKSIQGEVVGLCFINDSLARVPICSSVTCNEEQPSTSHGVLPSQLRAHAEQQQPEINLRLSRGRLALHATSLTSLL